MNTLNIELGIARKLVQSAIEDGYSLSVFDGEEWPVRDSREVSEIMKAFCATELDQLHIHDQEGLHIGAVVFVWGNGADVISDYTDVSEIRRLVDGG